MKTSWFIWAAFLALGLTPVSAPIHPDIPLNTWSIVAVDPATGDTGVAGASCLELRNVDAIAMLAPGKGAAVAQGLWSVENRNRVFQLLKDGNSADEIVRNARDFADRSPGQRQYGVITVRDGKTQIAAFTGEDTNPWSGSRQDAGMAVTVQGNLLEKEAVVANALAAFKANDDRGRNTLTDRLMRALEAGSAAGGDKRCNNGAVQQTAASTFILFARAKESAYAARDLGVTDAGSKSAPSLDLSVTAPKYGANPIPELRKQYDAWRDSRK